MLNKTVFNGCGLVQNLADKQIFDIKYFNNLF